MEERRNAESQLTPLRRFSVLSRSLRRLRLLGARVYNTDQHPQPAYFFGCAQVKFA
jgi:hypothetical protein